MNSAPDTRDSSTEAHIERLHRRGDYEAAATTALERYGSELFGFLTATTRDDLVAAEIYSQLSEDLWRGLPTFAWRCSLRTWLYVLARNAHARYRADGFRRRVGPWCSAVGAVEPIDRARTQTRPEHRTDTRNEFQRLREQLGADDQALLILRIDRGMAWRDIAVVMADEGEAGEAGQDESRRRHEARLRKRFERIKEKLRARALAEGLLRPRP